MTEGQSRRIQGERTSTVGLSHWFVLVAVLFVTCLLTANLIAVKLIQIFGLLLPAAIVIFPVSYILGDVLTEVYGYHQARRVIWLAFMCNLIMVAAIGLAQA
ncbi:MAG: VUT family protein, partial [Dehalococcoidia bacterium]